MKSNVFFAELVGTFALVFLGAGAAAVGAGGLLGVALAHGLTVATFAYLFGDLSGAHFNPAVTFALALNKTVKWAEAFFYWVAQLLGGVIAAAALMFILGGAGSGLGATVLAAGVSQWQGLLVEILLTFFLVNAIFFAAVAGKAGKRAGLVIGLTLVAAILMGGPLTGAALNPARFFGPAVFTAGFGDFWVYLVGPLVGAGLAFGFYKLMLRDKK